MTATERAEQIVRNWCDEAPSTYRKLAAGVSQEIDKAVEEAIKADRLRTASKVTDIARRIGPAARPEWIRGRLEELANQLRFWAS